MKRCLRHVIGVASLYLFGFHYFVHIIRNSSFSNNDTSFLPSALESSLEDFKRTRHPKGVDATSSPTDESKHQRSSDEVSNEDVVGNIDQSSDVLFDEKIPGNSNVLERDFSRVPGYIGGSNNSSLFGYVMRDLSNRFLPPASDQQQRKRRNQWRQQYPSNILVVSPGANKDLSHIIGKKKQMTTLANKQDLIKSFGYKIGPSFLVESVYYGHNAVGVDSEKGVMNAYDFYSGTMTTGDFQNQTTDILLAIFDPEQGKEDNAIPATLESNIKSGSIEFATFRISISMGSATRGGGMRGLNVSKVFLDAGYKLQVLSSSHAPTNRLNPYGPNTLLKDLKDVKTFLKFGITEILFSTSSSLTKRSRKAQKHDKLVFHSILFATRGLDLAIPSRTAFLDLTKDDQVLNVQKSLIPYLECPGSQQSKRVKINFREMENGNSRVEISCFEIVTLMGGRGSRLLEKSKGNVLVDFWHTLENLSLSEAACAKCTRIRPRKDNVTIASCNYRILSSDKFTTKSSSHEQTAKRGPNLLAIELKGVDQNMLDISMPSFKDSLQKLGIDFVQNFTAPRDVNKFWEKTWWEAASADINTISAYNRYRGSDGCSRYVRSHAEPLMHHGGQMADLFCVDYDRPNCLYGYHAANHLFFHMVKFIRMKQTERERWAAYVTLVEGEEETESLAGTLERRICKILRRIRIEMPSEYSNTIIIIFSHNVQHPVLFLKADRNVERLELNKRTNLTTSELNDIMKSIMTHHSAEEIREAFERHLITGDDAGSTTRWALMDEYKFDTEDLVAPPSILSFYADIPKGQKFQPITPTASIPASRATVVEGCNCSMGKKTESSWFPCKKHPWGEGASSSHPGREHYILVDCPDQPLHLEIDILRDLNVIRNTARKRRISGLLGSDNTNIIFLELDSVSQEYANRHFPKTRELLKKYRIKRDGDEDNFACMSGICSAEFPHTSLVGANSIPNQVAALAGCVSTTTQELCGIVDPSIGDICDDPDMMHYGLRLERIRLGAKEAYWCPDRDIDITPTPWIFGVSDSKGYINFFGEEFCFDHSPYVTQQNIFPKFFSHIESHRVFCSLVERKIIMENLNATEKQRWGVEMNDPCIEGYSCSKNFEKSTISLRFIEQIWEQYSKFPKFAFLNVMAAHDYSPEWEMMIPKAEAYDQHLSEFLKKMISEKNSQRTVIFVRSDHGLQKGPNAVDYALQVEHRHPWTELLIPEALVSSKSALFHNQARMLTGFDLYHTMRLLMIDRDRSQSPEVGIPHWSFDILAEEIAENRTCRDAKVDADLCRKAKQRRNFGVCNYLDADQAPFCERWQQMKEKRVAGTFKESELDITSPPF